MKRCWAALVVAGLAVPAAAQAPSAADRVLGSFAACRAIAAADARLQCFDKASVALEGAVKRKDVQIIDSGDVRKARRSLFGFTLPNLNIFGGGDPAGGREEDAFSEINSTVEWARPAASGRVDIRLADESGAVWETTEPMNWPPRPGAKIRIRKGALGNYFIAVDGRSYRGMRLR